LAERNALGARYEAGETDLLPEIQSVNGQLKEVVTEQDSLRNIVDAANRTEVNSPVPLATTATGTGVEGTGNGTIVSSQQAEALDAAAVDAAAANLPPGGISSQQAEILDAAAVDSAAANLPARGISSQQAEILDAAAVDAAFANQAERNDAAQVDALAALQAERNDAAAVDAALRDQTRNQQALSSLRNNQAATGDWRVKLSLAENSNYLYNSCLNGDILYPLLLTQGVIFPYTPAIDTAYKANYESYDLTHSNYRGYFYKNSYVDVINLRAQFTAQDNNEANYLLAVIHFFRSATKMFYGQDQQRGSPPPLVYIRGYGNFQFNNHPCLINQFNYSLPPDVDYIRAQNIVPNGTNQQINRIRNPVANNPLSYSVNRLLNSGLLPGALDFRPGIVTNLPTGEPTYVPTKMEITVTLLPVQSRQNISKNFSVRQFARGNLLKGGYW